MKLPPQIAIHWIAQQPTPYNDFLFMSFASDPEIDLIVHFMSLRQPTHPWRSKMAQGFKARFYSHRIALSWALVRLAVTATRQTLFIFGGNWFEPAAVVAILFLIIRRQHFVMWTDTPSLRKKRGTIRRIVRKIWLKLLFRYAHAVMGTGKPALDVLAAEGCSCHKLRDFPYIVDSEYFSPGTNVWIPGESPVIFLSSGTLKNSLKGFHLALDALAHVKQRTGIQFIYRIAGVGPDKGQLQKQAVCLGLQNNIRFLDWLEPEELPDFYRSGHIFLHPALFEPYGVVILEAMASGLPVVASSQTMAAIDLIQSGYNGLIHHADDINDLVIKILQLLEDPTRWQTIGEAARQTIKEWQPEQAIQVVKSIALK